MSLPNGRCSPTGLTDCRAPGFPCPDAYALEQVNDDDLAIADPAGPGLADAGIHGGRDEILVDGHLPQAEPFLEDHLTHHSTAGLTAPVHASARAVAGANGLKNELALLHPA